MMASSFFVSCNLRLELARHTLTFSNPFFSNKSLEDYGSSAIKFTKMAISGLCLPSCSQQFLSLFYKFAKILIALTKASKSNA